VKALYQICDSERPFIWTRQAEAHGLALYLFQHPFWSNSVRPTLSAILSLEHTPPPMDGIEESADRVYLPAGMSPRLLVGLQSIVDGWVTNQYS
jgi:hypothetical protein